METPEDQKRTREKIRKLGFRVSNHCNGFSDVDFKKLLIEGKIEIIGTQKSKSVSIVKKQKGIISKGKNDILKHSLPSVIDETTEYLVLRTMPGEKSLLHPKD